MKNEKIISGYYFSQTCVCKGQLVPSCRIEDSDDVDEDGICHCADYVRFEGTVPELQKDIVRLNKAGGWNCQVAESLQEAIDFDLKY